jgi:hypothetical protein
MFVGFPSFQKMAAAVEETPISLVQEILVRRGLFPKYDLIDIRGARHKPEFRYRVTTAAVVGMLVWVWVSFFSENGCCFRWKDPNCYASGTLDYVWHNPNI